jgi:hypothetical protein
MDTWIKHGRQGPRPSHAPRRLPLWFHPWRLFVLAKWSRKGSKAWKAYTAYLEQHPDRDAVLTETRAAIAKWLWWGIKNNALIHYTEGPQRDDFLHEPRGHLPMSTDCSGDVTQSSWAAKAPDPSGFMYRYVGWTGSILAFAYKHGRVFTDVSKALPGDDIVIGPGNGWHVVRVLEAGPDPLVSSNGGEWGPVAQRLSVDTREPKRVCQILI